MTYHSRDAPFCSDVGRNTLECHDGAGTCLFCNASLEKAVRSGCGVGRGNDLVDIDDVHDDAPLNV